MKTFDLAAMAQAAERILVPKSLDATVGVDMFTERTGIEIPGDLRQKMISRAGGRLFRMVSGRDIPGQLIAGWGDVGIASTELVMEYGNLRQLTSMRLAGPICRYSVLALPNEAARIRDDLTRGSRYPIPTRKIPATFPRYLDQIAATRDLPLMALDVPISGQGEATMEASGVGAMAERVVSGNTAARMGAEEVFILADIYPELVIRRQDADAYQSAA